MKKWLSAVCGAVMLTSAFAGLTACKEEQVELTMQEVYNANATAKLMQTYEKLGLVKTDAIDRTVVKTYLDGEVYYSSATQGTTILSECYDKAGTLGYVFEGGAYFSLLTTPENLRVKPTQAYENHLFEDKRLTLSEEVVSAVKKKDGILLQTKYSEEDSGIVALRDGLAYTAGEYISTNYVLDADTYRVISLERELVSPNNRTRYYKVEQKTDVKVTDYSRDLAEMHAFVKALTGEETGDNVWVMHVEANSNTPNEEDWKAVALKEHSFKIDLGKRYPTVYREVGLETEYVYADSDKESGYIKLYAKHVFIPEEYGFTWQDMIEANATHKLLSKYESITVSTTYGDDEGDAEYSANVTYVDKKMIYTGYSEDGRCYLMDGTKGYQKTGLNYAVIIDKEAEMQARARECYETAVFDSVWKEKEVIDYAEKRGGKWYITTILSKADYEELANGETDVAYIQTDYVFDAGTYRLCEYTVYNVYPDGAKEKECKTVLTVDAQTSPSGAEEMYAKMTATENVAFITVYLCDGGNLTKLYDGQRVKGDGLCVDYRLGRVELYTDEECTQVFEDTDKQKNTLVLYAVISGQGE